MSAACRYLCDPVREMEVFSASISTEREDPSQSPDFFPLTLCHPKISPLPR